MFIQKTTRINIVFFGKNFRGKSPPAVGDKTKYYSDPSAEQLQRIKLIRHAPNNLSPLACLTTAHLRINPFSVNEDAQSLMATLNTIYHTLIVILTNLFVSPANPIPSEEP